MSAETADCFPLGRPHALVREYARGAPRGRALDLGAGAGQNALYLAEALGYEVDVVDNAVRGVIVKHEEVLTGLARVASERRLPIRTWMQDMFTFDLGVNRYA